MNRILRSALVASVLAVPALPAWVIPSVAATTLRSSVLGNGATPSAGVGAAGRVLVGTAGQAAVGYAGSASKALCHGFWCNAGVHVAGIEDPPGGGLPTTLEFSLPAPNPAFGTVRFRLALPHAAAVRVDVFDVQGRMAGAMRAGNLDPGVYPLEWDGTDGDGHASGAGVFFARLEVDGRLVAQRRIVLLR
jgi:hypothetical protein